MVTTAEHESDQSCEEEPHSLKHTVRPQHRHVRPVVNGQVAAVLYELLVDGRRELDDERVAEKLVK